MSILSISGVSSMLSDLQEKFYKNSLFLYYSDRNGYELMGDSVQLGLFLNQLMLKERLIEAPLITILQIP